ncbi:MAG: cytochrome c biogenesis protein ResB [Deltaproteobacteria bacterium]|jgi:hypothetical protein|nr:cytochrome c biogenesis protein ResB [Deltaproteobacteria bacterium]
MTSSRLGNWLRRQHVRLASGRLTAWLLAVLVFVLGVYLFIPQDRQVSALAIEGWVEQKGLLGRVCHALGFNSILHSPLFWGTCALMFVNLVLCMIRRIRSTLSLFRFPERPPQASLAWQRREIAGPTLAEEGIAELLGKRGFRTLVDDGRVYGLRGRFAIAGHWIFYLGLLAMLVVGTLVALAPKPFRGLVGVGDGEPFALHRSPFLSTRDAVAPELPDLRFQVEEIETLTEGTETVHFEAHVTTPEGDRGIIGVNRPFRQTPYQVMVHGFGYMAGWAITDSGGRMVNGAWVKLIPFPLLRSDTFSIGRGESTVRVRLYPDHYMEGETHQSRSYELQNPRYTARIFWRGSKIYDGLLEPGQRVPLEDGLEFFFLPEIRRYATLEVIQERGYVAVFACLGVMILGLAIRYFRIRKEVLVQRSEGSMEVFGRGEIFESLFAEEFDQLVDALASASLRSEDPRGAA